MKESLLTGLRALDLTDEKGYVCGKILANMGVDVIKVERPEGDAGRNIPPFYDDIPGPERSLYWLAYNADKRGVTLDIETGEGQDTFRKLIGKSDFVLDSFTPGYLDGLGLGYEALRKINPGLVMASITPFGQSGPLSRFRGCDLTVAAMAGVLENTGDPDRPPVKESLDSTYFQAGIAAALGLVMAYYHRLVTGEGQQVDISLQEVAAGRTTSIIIAWQCERLLLKRSGPFTTLGRVASRWIWRCKDGYLFWHMIGGVSGASANRALSLWIDEEQEENAFRVGTEWEEFDKGAMTQETYDAFEKTIGSFFMRHTKKEIAEESLKRGVNACIANDPADVLADRQLAARGFWTEVDHPELGTHLTYPKYFFLSDETENFSARKAPGVGEHNQDIYSRELGFSKEKIADLKIRRII